MNQNTVLTIFLIVVIIWMLTKTHIKEPFDLPNCENEALCNDGNTKVNELDSLLSSINELYEETESDIATLNTRVTKTDKLMKKLHKQAKKCN